MKSLFSSWQLWAALSAAFAALTAIFAKVGVENVGSDFATFIRTIVILCAAGAILALTGQWQPLNSVSGRSYLFLVLSGLATGGSWLCYFRALKLGDAARVAPIDKLSVVLVAIFGALFLGEKLAAAELARRRADRRRRHPGGVQDVKDGRRASRLRASISAIALEPSRATVLSARLVRMIGTRAPSTMPAISASAR